MNMNLLKQKQKHKIQVIEYFGIAKSLLENEDSKSFFLNKGLKYQKSKKDIQYKREKPNQFIDQEKMNFEQPDQENKS